MIFNLREIEQSPAVNSLIYESSMPSTSDKAKFLLAAENIPRMPVLVLCDQQTAGRGQPGKSWQADRHSLTFTWCIPADFVPPTNRKQLPLLAGISVCQGIDAIEISNSKLKWPNDVMLGRKKACGILVEKVAAAESSFFLIGIGVNVNQLEMSLGPNIDSGHAFPPTSLRQYSGTEADKQSLLLSIVERLNENVLGTSLLQSASKRFEFFGEQIQFMLPSQEIVDGTFCGINADGQIEISIDGNVQAFSSGHILPGE